MQAVLLNTLSVNHQDIRESMSPCNWHVPIICHSWHRIVMLDWGEQITT
jgi:hypothetical protein